MRARVVHSAKEPPQQLLPGEPVMLLQQPQDAREGARLQGPMIWDGQMVLPIALRADPDMVSRLARDAIVEPPQGRHQRLAVNIPRELGQETITILSTHD